MKFRLLADNPNAVGIVARWYFDEWDSKVPGVTVDCVAENVATFTERDTAPLIVLAIDGEEIIGAAELKIREMKIYPEYEYWIGGVYVTSGKRGHGIGSRLVKEILKRASTAGVETLYLHTQDLSGGIYAELGFKPLEEVYYNGNDVLVMAADIIVSQ